MAPFSVRLAQFNQRLKYIYIYKSIVRKGTKRNSTSWRMYGHIFKRRNSFAPLYDSDLVFARDERAEKKDILYKSVFVSKFSP